MAEVDSSSLPLEFPELQVVGSEGDSTDATTKSVMPRNIPLSRAKKRFGLAAIKVMRENMENDSKLRGKPWLIEEQPVKEESMQDLSSNRTMKQSLGTEMLAVPGRHGNGRKQSLTTETAEFVPKNDALSPIETPESRMRKSSLPNIGGKFQITSVMRLARFRRMVNRFNEKSIGTSSSRTSLGEVMEEEDLLDTSSPQRFCSTLSPEAQYSMLKGYEDVLLQKLRKKNKDVFLLRVKTPHQSVAAIHLAELNASISEPPQTNPYRAQSLVLSRGGRIDNTCMKAAFGSPTKTRKVLPKVQQNPEGSFLSIPKEKKHKLSLRFQRAMDILDCVKDSQGLPVTSLKEKRHVTDPISNYNRWSQSWAREFKFQYNYSQTS